MTKTSPSSGAPRITIKTVAADAGVSVAAVSKVIRNAYGVSDGLRVRVNASIKKLGYRPSTGARGMRGRTYAIGLLLLDLRNPFTGELVDAIKPSLRAEGYNVVIGISEAQAALEVSLIEMMVDMRVDGLVIIAPRLAGDELARYARNVPMVIIGHHEATAETFDTVNSDDHAGAVLATQALIDAGCSNIHMVNTAQNRGSSHEVSTHREAGFRHAMGEAGHSLAGRVHGLPERNAALDPALRSILDLDPFPDGLFCWSDIHALPLLNAVVTQKVSTRKGFRIIGYDNTPAAAMPMIGLSSVDQQPKLIGQRAADLLLSRLGGRTTAEHVLVPPELRLREI